ncbi:MAG: response regulator [Longimonas sp.]|uniref:hybrid sensor histidine kinase/response regulator n=1 Tax=Longimonas sp. TaxID=2039626 RepID=UPI003974A457
MMTTTEVIDVLLVEDDEDDYVITKALLSRAESIDCNLEWASSYEEGLDAILSGGYDACLVDYRLGAHTGLDLLHAVNEQGNRTPIILLTGQGDLEIDLTAMAAGAADYLSKEEIDAPLLERSIRYAVERAHADQRIREQAALLDKARDAIIAYDMEGQVVYWNKSAERLTGWSAEEMLGEPARERLYTNEQQKKLKECFATIEEKGEWTGELRQHTKDGEDLVVESRWTLVRDNAGNPSSVLVINTDITERKQLEMQFLRSQRMESIGRLVGGIAHDLGNLLVPILLGVKVLQQRFDDDSQVERTLSMIQKSAERGSDMVDQVLAFARGVEGERVTLDPGAIIDEVDKIIRETFPDRITVETEVDEALDTIVGDATQIQQVLMNLSVNARDAMPDGGTLAIKAENVDLSESDARRNIDAEPGPYVRITVSDTGTGIPDDALDKIFEPFFSTKPEGEGTGLGLSTAYSIVKSHDGFIDVRSEENQGTTFRIFLPVTIAESGKAESSPDRGDTHGQGEVVLIVDDEEFIRDTAQQTLESAGYRAIVAADGAEALELMEDYSDAVDAVITDLRMPNMNGHELIDVLNEKYPALPIIAASGASDSEANTPTEADGHTFLPKPFTAEKLYAALHDVLHTSTKAG